MACVEQPHHCDCLLGGGLIVRTAAKGAELAELERDLALLEDQWEAILAQVETAQAPSLIHAEVDTALALVRDDFRQDVDELIVDDEAMHDRIVSYVRDRSPELATRIKRHTAQTELLRRYGVDEAIESTLKRRVDLPSGGYLLFDYAEAFTIVDVNTGRFVGKGRLEDTIVHNNLEAAREVVRQLRLRDLGGIIVCDFIDMETRGNRDKVLQELRTHLGRDRARTKAFAVSDLGLIEMTRQRVRQSHLQSMTQPCPTCHGTGRVFTPETIVRRMERSVRRIAVEGRKDNLIVKLHPETAIYVLENEKDLIQKLEKGLGFRLEMRDDPLLKPDEFKLVVKGAGRDVTQQYAVA